MEDRERGGTTQDGHGAKQSAGDVTGSAVTREAVTWAFRLLIGREPRDDAELEVHLPHVSLQNLRIAFAESPEFESFYSNTVKRRKLRFGMSPAVLRPPPAGLPWRFEPPTMEKPVSQLCTASQFQEPAFAEIAGAMGVGTRLHRSVWEAVFIVCVLATEGCIEAGRSAIGFGVQRERVVSLLASRGVAVMATSQPAEGQQDEAVPPTEAFNLFYPEVIRLAEYERLVALGRLDMRRLPANLGGLADAIWSLSAVQRLGSVTAIGDFIEASLGALRPGGIAVHTMDLNVSSGEESIETGDFAAPARRDLEALVSRLVDAGHEVLPVNLHPGFEEADCIVDVPPYGLPHLKVGFGGAVLASFGLVVRKAR